MLTLTDFHCFFNNSLEGTIGNTGICDAWVTGVDFAMGVSILVVPGRVLT